MTVTPPSSLALMVGRIEFRQHLTGGDPNLKLKTYSVYKQRFILITNNLINCKLYYPSSSISGSI